MTNEELQARMAAPAAIKDAFQHKVLRILEGRRGEVITKEELLRLCGARGASTRALDSACVRIRQAGYPLENVWGVGYRLASPPEAGWCFQCNSDIHSADDHAVGCIWSDYGPGHPEIGG